MISHVLYGAYVHIHPSFFISLNLCGVSSVHHELNSSVISLYLRYIQENYSKIRDVEKELESLTLEMKLTAGPKKAGM